MIAPSPKAPLLPSVDGLVDYRQTGSFASAYLDTFYRNRPPTNDERAVVTFLVKHLRAAARGQVILEVGCGPTVHHTFPFVPHVSQIHMADYLPENLVEVEKWCAGSRVAPDWAHYSALVLETERSAVSREAIQKREDDARAKIRRLLHCDLKEPLILGRATTYPVVTAFYCTEEVGVTTAAWERVMENLTRAVEPGGHLFLVCLRDTTGYMIGDTLYPCARVSEDDTLRALRHLGFDMTESTVEAAPITGQEREGVVGVVLVAAKKRGPTRSSRT